MFKTIHGIAPTYLFDRIVMNFDVNGYDTRGSHYPKRPIEIVLCIWVAHCGMNCLNLYKILGILNYLNVIIECTNLSLTHDQIDIIIFFCNLSVSAWQWCNDYFPTSEQIPLCTWIWTFVFYWTQSLDRIQCYICVTSLHDSFLLMDLLIHMFTFIFYRIAFTCSF